MVCPHRFCAKLGGRDLVLVNVPVRGPAQSLWAKKCVCCVCGMEGGVVDLHVGHLGCRLG